jgi:hypothetical protein
MIKALLAACCGMAFCLASAGVSAQSLPPGVHVGMTVAELQAAGFDLQRVKRPERMATGARGLWQQAVPGDGGTAFELTYFIRGTIVDRVDVALTESPETPAAAFERMVGTLRATYGAELRSRQSAGSDINETASWNTDDVDIAAYLVGHAGAEKIHIVYRRRELKDGSTL